MSEMIQGHGGGAAEASEPDDFKAMLIGAVVIVVLSLVPYVRLVCCLTHLLGIWLAISLFTGRYRLTLSYGEGIRLGVLTSLLGNYGAWLIGVVLWLVMGDQPGAEEGRQLASWIAGKFGGPEAVEDARKQLAAQATAAPGLRELGVGVVVVGISAAVSGVLGGATGALMFRRGPRNRDGEEQA